MVREEMVFRSGQILPTVMETMDEQGDTGSQEGMEMELPDEGVESQEGNQSFHPSDLTFEQVLEEMAEIHEELKAKSVPRVQLKTLEESLVELGLIKRCQVLVKNIEPELEAKGGEELPDEGVESQEEAESKDETESQEETKSQDEMEPQMETPNNLHWNWADEVEDMVERQIDKKLELWEKCCGEAGHVKQICCRCQRAGHRARECDAKKALDGEELPTGCSKRRQKKQASLGEAGGHLVGGQDTGEYSTGRAEVLGGVRAPTSSSYPPGRGPTRESLLSVNRGRLSRSSGVTPRRPLGSRNMEKNSYGSGKKGRCYRCRRPGHLARECYARKTLDGKELPLPRPMKEEPESEVVHTDSE